MIKRILCFVSALAFCLSIFALCASAEGPDVSYEYVPAELPTDSLTWDFDAGSGTLSIRGSGPMRSYLEADAEWAVHRDQIRSVILEDGISSVGSYAFYDFPALTEVCLPDGKGGNELIIPDGVERLGEYLFYGRFDEGCTVVLPESVREIGTMSLPGSMASLSLPSGLERIDDNVFYGGISIGTIFYGGTAEQWQAVSVGDGNAALSSVPLQTS